jgi:hypothetical protein
MPSCPCPQGHPARHRQVIDDENLERNTTMTTSVTTTNPVRSDVLDAQARPESRRTSRGWAFAGIGAAVCGAATIATSSMVDTVYQEKYQTNLDGFAADLHDKAGVLFAFHSITALGAVLMLVFAAGLHRRLRAVMADSIVPAVAGAALAGTAVVSILGSGLDTEFMMGLATNGKVPDSSAAIYNNWIGTIPWLWTLAGLAGLGLYVAGRRGVVARWVGRVGLVLGGLTVLLGISPLEYMSGVTGSLWLLATSLGFAFGDRRFRGAFRA